MLTKEQQIKQLHNRYDELKKDTKQMDYDLLEYANKSQIVQMNHVCLDERNGEYEVCLWGVIGSEAFEKAIYKGDNKEIADDIVDNLLQAFDITFCGFDNCGTFYM